MNQTQEIISYSSEEAFVQASVDLFVEHYQKAVTTFGSFIVAVSGGSTPLSFFSALAEPVVSEKIDWKNVHFFWVDERMVPNHNPENNFNNAYYIFLRKIDIPYQNKHRIITYKDPYQVAKEYEQEIRDLFLKIRQVPVDQTPKFDLILLGMGEDGHTASLFPTSASLNEEEKLIIAVKKPNTEQMRISMTFPLLENAAAICVMVKGRKKMKLIRKVNEFRLPHLPIAKLKKKHPNLIWVTQVEE